MHLYPNFFSNKKNIPEFPSNIIFPNAKGTPEKLEVIFNIVIIRFCPFSPKLEIE